MLYEGVRRIRLKTTDEKEENSRRSCLIVDSAHLIEELNKNDTLIQSLIESSARWSKLLHFFKKKLA